MKVKNVLLIKLWWGS